ncbi:MAG: hypothetical protein RL603_242 [Pseudomonadota bacterium]
MKRRYTVVDVFSDTSLRGNPVAVVIDAAELDDAAMQHIARWTNLSETTFLLPPTAPDATHRVRIFTPRSELPFAGHPTLGSAHAALAHGLVSGALQLVQQCGAGLVPVEVTQGVYRLRLPRAATRELEASDRTALRDLVGPALDPQLAPQLIDVGPKWIVARMRSREALLDLQPEFSALAAFERSMGATGLTLFADGADDVAEEIEVRSFAPSQGVDEDPVCGSGNGAVAVYRLAHGLVHDDTRYVAAQGCCVGRRGRIEVQIEAGEVWIGGRCVSTVTGIIDV